MEDSPIARLPPELREKIYKEVLPYRKELRLHASLSSKQLQYYEELSKFAPPTDPVLATTAGIRQQPSRKSKGQTYIDPVSIISEAEKQLRLRSDPNEALSLALTGTCKLVREECLPLLYRANDFVYAVDRDATRILPHDWRVARYEKNLFLSDWLKPLEEWWLLRQSQQTLCKPIKIAFAEALETHDQHEKEPCSRLGELARLSLDRLDMLHRAACQKAWCKSVLIS